MSLNKVMLIGNVGKDPEVRYLEGNGQNGQPPKVASITLATSERYRDRNGETKENTEWHNIVAWRGLADLAEKYIRKGTQIYIEGRLRTRSYTDKAGVTKYTTEILADAIQLLGRKSDNPASQGTYGGGYQAPQPASPTAPGQAAGGYSGPTMAPAGFPATAPVVEDNPVDDLPF